MSNNNLVFFWRTIDSLLRHAAQVYRSLPIPIHFRNRINQFLLGRLYFLTRHVLRALDPPGDERLGLSRALVRLRSAQSEPRTSTPTFVSDNPEVSIIIPVFNHANYTALCLQSIAEAGIRRQFEIIIVDDASTDETSDLLAAYVGLRVLRNPSNMGFLRSCNLGASLARGRLLLILNNDTWVVPGWLDALANTLDETPRAGLVGSKLVYPDGRLQEAGGIIWNDASGWNLGRLQSPDNPEFNFLRDVDYCSGASIMLEKSLFDRLGRFDERYVPAYFEDTDLAFSVRAAGLRVLYQPTSEVIHFEGISSGRDLKEGVKAHQVTNQIKFHNKWASKLASHRTPGELPRFEKERSVARRALVIDVRTPMPDRDSGSIDAVNTFRLLIEFGYKVTFIPAECLFHAGRYTQALQRIGIECLYEPFLTDAVTHLRQRGAEYDLVMLYRAQNAARQIDNVRRYCPNARVIFNTVDLHFLRERRQAELTESAALLQHAERTRQAEFDTIRKADATIVLSHSEREILEKDIPDATLFTIPLLREVPGRSEGFDARSGMLFIGGYEHPPNIDAITYFAAAIWPLITHRMPDATCQILGSNAPANVRALHGNGLYFVGYVDDLAPYFNSCRLSVVPLRYGAGIKGKIATSLGYGVPCVATNIAAEGMGLVSGRDAVIVEGPQDFANAVVRLYGDKELWQSLSDNGLVFVERNYSMASTRNQMGAMLHYLLAVPPRDRNATIERRQRQTVTAATHLAISMVDSFADYRQRESRMQTELAKRAEVEARRIKGRWPFTMRGYCHCCGGRRHFFVDFQYSAPGSLLPNWRERLICWRCRMNNRSRASLQIFEQLLRPTLRDAIYVTEQTTSLYQWLVHSYPNVTGSEYLGDAVEAGKINASEIRNESITKLSFADRSFDHILCFDVLEHVPDFRIALAECLRCLKPGGSLLFSVPFRHDLTEHLERARIGEDGSVEHMLPPEYHGDPINAAGCLCFRHFGWNLLDDMRSLGFARATACIYWSRELGYLGGEQMVFLGIKPAAMS